MNTTLSSNLELRSLRKSGISAGFKASALTLFSFHLLILISSYFFVEIFSKGNQFILIVQASFLFVLLSLISNGFVKSQLHKITEQYGANVLNTQMPFLKKNVFGGARIASFILFIEIAALLRFGAPAMEKLPQIFGYLGLVLFVSTPFFFVAIYLATKNEFNKWEKEFEQGK